MPKNLLANNKAPQGRVAPQPRTPLEANGTLIPKTIPSNNQNDFGTSLLPDEREDQFFVFTSPQLSGTELSESNQQSLSKNTGLPSTLPPLSLLQPIPPLNSTDLVTVLMNLMQPRHPAKEATKNTAQPPTQVFSSSTDSFIQTSSYSNNLLSLLSAPFDPPSVTESFEELRQIYLTSDDSGNKENAADKMIYKIFHCLKGSDTSIPMDQIEKNLDGIDGLIKLFSLKYNEFLNEILLFDYFTNHKSKKSENIVEKIFDNLIKNVEININNKKEFSDKLEKLNCFLKSDILGHIDTKTKNKLLNKISKIKTSLDDAYLLKEMKDLLSKSIEVDDDEFAGAYD